MKHKLTSPRTFAGSKSPSFGGVRGGLTPLLACLRTLVGAKSPSFGGVRGGFSCLRAFAPPTTERSRSNGVVSR